MKVYPTAHDGPFYPTLLRAARIEAGLSTSELARLAGVDRSTVSCMETRAQRGGQLRGYYPTTAHKVARALGLDLGQLFDVDPQAGAEVAE